MVSDQPPCSPPLVKVPPVTSNETPFIIPIAVKQPSPKVPTWSHTSISQAVTWWVRTSLPSPWGGSWALPALTVPFTSPLPGHPASSGPHLPPAPRHGVVQIVFVVGELTDAIVDCHTAAARGQLLLRHLHPAKGAHGETLPDTKQGAGDRGSELKSEEPPAQDARRFAETRGVPDSEHSGWEGIRLRGSTNRI